MNEDRRVPLSTDRHRGRFWRRFTSYDFARHRRSVPLVLAEAEPVAAAMPVVFAPGEDGLEPVALLRIIPGGPSPFVSPQGLWLATYVPSVLRVHPFSARAAGDGRMNLMIDEDSGLITGDPSDEAFFDAEGGLAKPTAELVEFFRQREASALRGRAAVARLAALDLLTPFAPSNLAAPPGSFDGLLAIDRARFDALEDAAWLELRRLGAIALAHAHLVSMAQVPWLARAEQLKDEEAAGLRRTASAPAADLPSQRGVEDFLAAFAAAQDTDLPQPDPEPQDPTKRKPH